MILRRHRRRFRNSDDRDWDSEVYKEWRRAVYKRDGYRCVLCPSSWHLNAHHIKKWARHPHLRYDIDNGITLCETCHKHKVTGNEEIYEPLFLAMIGKTPMNKGRLNLQLQLIRERLKDEGKL